MVPDDPMPELVRPAVGPVDPVVAADAGLMVEARGGTAVVLRSEEPLIWGSSMLAILVT